VDKQIEGQWPDRRTYGLAENKEAIKRLERHAQAIARKLLWKYDLGHDDAWHEDITQSLLLAGWQVWRDTGDERLPRFVL